MPSSRRSSSSDSFVTTKCQDHILTFFEQLHPTDDRIWKLKKRTRQLAPTAPVTKFSRHAIINSSHYTKYSFSIMSSQNFAVYGRSNPHRKKSVTVISGNECYRRLASKCVRWSNDADVQSQYSQDSWHSYKSIDSSGDSRRDISLRMLLHSGEIETKRALRRSGIDLLKSE